MKEEIFEPLPFIEFSFIVSGMCISLKKIPKSDKISNLGKIITILIIP